MKRAPLLPLPLTIHERIVLQFIADRHAPRCHTARDFGMHLPWDRTLLGACLRRLKALNYAHRYANGWQTDTAGRAELAVAA